VGFLTRESQELHIRNLNPEPRLFASIRAFLENLDVVEPPAGGSSWPCRKPMVNRTGISASNAGACIGSLVVFLRGAVIQPVHIELVLAETHPGCGWKNRRTDSRRT